MRHGRANRQAYSFLVASFHFYLRQWPTVSHTRDDCKLGKKLLVLRSWFERRKSRPLVDQALERNYFGRLRCRFGFRRMSLVCGVIQSKSLQSCRMSQLTRNPKPCRATQPPLCVRSHWIPFLQRRVYLFGLFQKKPQILRGRIAADGELKVLGSRDDRPEVRWTL